jgi:Protein of unknown function (DUF3551)
MVAIVALGAMTGNQANAKEFCRQDVTGHMTGCGYDTMEQCKAASAGIGGDCFRDPFLKDNHDAFAYQPNSPSPEEERASTRRSNHQTIKDHRGSQLAPRTRKATRPRADFSRGAAIVTPKNRTLARQGGLAIA